MTEVYEGDDPMFVGNALDLIGAIKDAPPDFIQKNGTWLITVIGLFSACIGAILTYFLKSRCTEIKCLGLSCKRQVIDLANNEVEVTSAQA